MLAPEAIQLELPTGANALVFLRVLQVLRPPKGLLRLVDLALGVDGADEFPSQHSKP